MRSGNGRMKKVREWSAESISDVIVAPNGDILMFSIGVSVTATSECIQ